MCWRVLILVQKLMIQRGNQSFIHLRDLLNIIGQVFNMYVFNDYWDISSTKSLGSKLIFFPYSKLSSKMTTQVFLNNEIKRFYKKKCILNWINSTYMKSIWLTTF